jgi:hypothetical protein
VNDSNDAVRSSPHPTALILVRNLLSQKRNPRKAEPVYRVPPFGTGQNAPDSASLMRWTELCLSASDWRNAYRLPPYACPIFVEVGMPDYRRYRVPGGIYFFAVNSLERRLNTLVRHVDALREAVRATETGTAFSYRRLGGICPIPCIRLHGCRR